MFLYRKSVLLSKSGRSVFKHIQHKMNKTTIATATATETIGQSLVLDYNYSSGTTIEHTTSMGPAEFMLSGNKGIYTAIRTVCGDRLFLYDSHLQRISNSHRMALPDDKGRRDDPEYWRQLLTPLIKRGLDTYKSMPGEETKITVLVGNQDARLHFTRLRTPSSPSCWVKFVSGVMRDNPEVKNIQWVHERETLEALIKPPLNEIVLIDNTHGLKTFYEGISSNFFATRRIANSNKNPDYLNFQLLSAPKNHVLLGTVMKLVLEICERDNIQVVYDPTVDLDRWNGAFVSSTSRWVLPIAKIVCNDFQTHELDGNDPLVCHLHECVINIAKEQSTKI